MFGKNGRTVSDYLDDEGETARGDEDCAYILPSLQESNEPEQIYFYEFAQIMSAEEQADELEFEEVWRIVVEERGDYSKCIKRFKERAEAMRRQQDAKNLDSILEGYSPLEKKLLLEEQKELLKNIKISNAQVPSELQAQNFPSLIGKKEERVFDSQKHLEKQDVNQLMKQMFVRENFSRQVVENFYRSTKCNRKKTIEILRNIVKKGGNEAYKVVSALYFKGIMGPKKHGFFDEADEQDILIKKKDEYRRIVIDEKNQNIAEKLFEVYQYMPRKKGDLSGIGKHHSEIQRSIKIKQQMSGFFKAAIRAHHLKDSKSFTEISKRAKQMQQRYRELRIDDAVQVFQEKNYDKEKDKTLDLHGLFVKEAVALVTLILFDMQQRVPRSTNFKIITGAGNHSAQGIAKLRPAIKNLLEQNHYKFTENRGSLDVKFV